MMENRVRFRNHISIVFENVIRTVGVVFFIFVGNLLTSQEDMSEGIPYVGLISLGIMIFLIAWQLLLWARTYISIQENTLVVERSTLNRKKNTIGLKNISNVNLEQNLLEMLLGTCKVKIDTNTLSTANETDVSIVLKKKDAEHFRQMILGKYEEPEQTPAKEKITADVGTLLQHGFFSMNLLSILILVGVVAGAAGMLSEISFEEAQEGLGELILSSLAMIWIVGGVIWSIVKGFVTYIDFKIERKDNEILLNYGLLKKVAYAIPVEKINAVQLKQTALARVGKCYMVEIVNVGLDNEETEENSFLLPYARKERIFAQLKQILPEFYDGLAIQEMKQEKCVWVIWIPKILWELCFAAVVYGFAVEFLPNRKLEAGIACVIGVVLLGLIKIARYYTEGYSVSEEFLKLTNGSFGRTTLLVRYDKIQYIKAKQNFIAKRYKMQRGEVFLLATAKNQIQSLPYFKEETLEILKHKLKV